MLIMISQRPDHPSTAAINSSEAHPFAINDQFELPPTKRQKVTSSTLARKASQVSTSSAADLAPRMVMSETSPTYSKGHDVPVANDGAKSQPGNGPQNPSSSPFAAASVLTKPKRVRTGCLTCRNRHLKCDEAMPICVNCQKSNRKCERGIRLNFIDLKVEHLYTLPPVDWKVRFKDESRQIASEYVGGQERYPPYGSQSSTPSREPISTKDPPQHPRAAEPVVVGSVHPMGSPLGHLPATHNLYYPAAHARPFHELSFSGYEEQMSQTTTRRNTETLLVTGSGPTPTSSLSGGERRRASFSLGRALDPYTRRDDITQPIHSYKSSDVSSVASSLATQAESSSGSFRHGPGSGAPDPHDGLVTPQSEKNGERDYLNSADEIYYMQTFVEEVAVWMDCLDSQQHFGRVIPYHALKCPMLLNAFLACGVQHLTLVERGGYKDDNSSHYYNTATMQLLRSLQNPERNAAECATTAVVLNMYELMSEQPAARMYHMSGARALIRECGWDAKTTGIGAACFWLNVGMEILSCLAFNWVTEWSPDHWGIDPDEFMSMTDPSLGGENLSSTADRGNLSCTMTNEDFPSSTGSVVGVGEEEIWVHRVLYIVANVANFRANIPQREELSPHDEQVRLQSRFAEWQRLKTWCDTWNANCPRSMRPYGYLFASSTTSAFPKVWLIKRPAVVGRLLYHTAMCLLAQINPHRSHHHGDDEERAVQLHHAHQVCGIAAHTNDHGVYSIMIRSLAIAGPVLTDIREQEEVIGILTRIHRTGWKQMKRVESDLHRAWGWEPPEPSIAGADSRLTSSGIGLPCLVKQQILMSPAAPGGPFGATAMPNNQLFGRREQQQSPYMQQEYRRFSHPLPVAAAAAAAPSVPPPPPLILMPSTNATTGLTENRRPYISAALAVAPGATAPLFPAPRNNSIVTASPSSHASPAATAYTSASVSTPPSAKPTINPLLAQADFNQPNHPYREWYKPPERAARTEGPEAPHQGHGHGPGHVHSQSQSNTYTHGAMWPY